MPGEDSWQNSYYRNFLCDLTDALFLWVVLVGFTVDLRFIQGGRRFGYTHIHIYMCLRIPTYTHTFICIYTST